MFCRSVVFLAVLQAGLLAQAHMTIFHPSMYGWPIKWEDQTGWPTAYDPVSPLGPSWDIDDWWFRGTAVQAMVPDAGVYAELPAGGSISLEIACNIAWTTYGYDYTNVACPGNTGAYHAGTPGDDVQEELLSGCALAIADVDDISLVTWDNLVIFSVQQECVWQVNTTFEIPAAMPACTGSHCICGWFWLANNGTGNSYMTGFNCEVTRDGPNAAPAKTIGPISDPAWCPDDINDCQTGAKRPIYFYQNEVNVEWIDNYNRPGYHNVWSFSDGAQNDIFNDAPAVPTPKITLGSTNLALNATALASSWVDAQPPSSAIDGVIKGYTAYTGDTYDTNEWSSDSEGAGAWFRLTFTQPQWVARVVLWDRPNMMDRVHAAKVTFSDGTTEQVGYVTNDAAFGAYLDLSAPVYTKYVLIEITAVSGTTSAIGLSEVQVFGPASTSSLTTPVNLATGATVTASSSSGSSKASSAIDGWFGGYTDADGDTTDSQEWSSNGEGAGAWLKLALASAKTINTVVLSDRPNVNDQITGATLSFSDGSSVTVGALPNDGASLAVTFTARSVTWVKLTVTSVSSTTSNIGLSEIQLFNSNAAAVTALSTSTTSRTSPAQRTWASTLNAQSLTTPGPSAATTSSSSSSSKTTTTSSTTSKPTTTTTTTTPKQTTTTPAPNLISVLVSILNPHPTTTTTTKAPAAVTPAPAVVVAGLAKSQSAAASKSKSLSLSLSASKSRSISRSKSKSASAYSAKHHITTKKVVQVAHTTTKKKTTTTRKTTAKKVATTKKVAKIASIVNKVAAASKSKSKSLSKSKSISKAKSASKAKARLAALKKGKKTKRALPSPAPGHKMLGRAPVEQTKREELSEWETEAYEPVEMNAFDLSGRDMANPFAVIPEDEVEGGPKEEVEQRRERKRVRRTSAVSA